MEEAFYKISIYLYNKNVLEYYAQIAQSGPKSMIRDIEGLSKKQYSSQSLARAVW